MSHIICGDIHVRFPRVIYFLTQAMNSPEGLESETSDITISILLSKTSSSRNPGQFSFENGDGESGVIICFIFLFKSIYFDFFRFQLLELKFKLQIVAYNC